MEKFKVDETEKITLGYIKELINESPDKIRAEFDRTENDWFACFVTRIFAVESYLRFAKEDQNLPEEEYRKLQDRVEISKAKLTKYRADPKYKNLGRELPTEDVREDLIDSLDIFRE